MAFDQQGRLSEIGRVFYVSIMDGSRKCLAAGPFADHQDALEAVDVVREYVMEHDFKAAFYTFGTAGFEGDNPPQGKLNSVLEIEMPVTA